MAKGTRYAVAVSEPGSSGFGVVAHLGGDGTACEGTVFYANGSAEFTEQEGPWDMAITVLVG